MVETEKNLIGCLLIKPKLLVEVMRAVDEEDFSDSGCRLVYKTMLKLFGAGKDYSVLSILHQSGGDIAELKMLVYECSQIPSAAPYKILAEKVSTRGRKRRALSSAESLCAFISDDVDNEVCQALAGEVLKQLGGTTIGGAMESVPGFEKCIDGLPVQKKHISTGIGVLDAYVRISPGDMVLLAGRPSSGKTAFALTMLLNMAKDKRCVFFSLETSSEKLFERMVSNVSGVDYSMVQKGGMSDGYIFLIKQQKELFDSLDFTVIESSGWTVSQIQNRALQERAEVVFIDYLGLIQGKQGKSQYEKVTQISIDLHVMAQQNKFALIALSQMNRAGKNEPDMTSLRDSGQLEQDADVIIFISGSDLEAESWREIYISKNKGGRQGKIPFTFEGHIQRFTAED